MKKLQSNIKIYSSVTPELINNDIIKAIKDKVNIFKKKLKHDAPYEDIIGHLCDYEMIETDEDVSGYCDLEGKKIAYKEGGLPIIFHEIGHTIQYDLGYFEHEPIMSSRITVEQQCETIAYYMYNAIYKHKTLGPDAFTSYFTKHDLLWFRDWNENWCEDDMEAFFNKLLDLEKP